MIAITQAGDQRLRLIRFQIIMPVTICSKRKPIKAHKKPHSSKIAQIFG